ncbi:MAG TPA: DUF1570 domain-containing protein [Candidatus Omnitrophota bacterium]|nr:DUF1570 domain-containing protein [Candidatus Omnitrophota bacterium]HRY85719.1 DUF1570 domain-containing protein [Candidatus Omnitrophota bacterium]
MKSGSMIQGVIVSETPSRITIKIAGGEVGFPASDIAEIRRGETLVKSKDGIEPVYAPSEEEAPYPRIYLTDGRIASGKQITREGNTFYLKQALEGGGTISFGFEADKTEKIELWPPPSDETLDRDFKALRRLNMKYSYKKPPYYIVSTVESSDLVLYFRTLQRFCSDFGMQFMDFIDTEKPAPALGVVIFGHHDDFLHYAGLPKGTNTAGFYMPDKKFLVLFNMKETDMVRYRLARAEHIEKNIGQYKTQIEMYSGPNSEGKWAAYDYLEKIQFNVEAYRMRLEAWARDLTMQTIRHEAGHQLFDLLGIDSGRSYRGAWLSEGLAEYVSTDPFGDINKDRLMFIRGELEGGRTLMPLQYLMGIPNGAGIRKLQDPNYTLLAYAQSWAFIHFLMARYQKGFLGYIHELMQTGKDFDASKDQALLEKNLGKTIQDLDGELEKYIREIMVSKLDAEEYDFYRLIEKAS